MWFATPAHAAFSSTAADGLLAKVVTAVANPLISLLFAIAVLYFMWGVFTFIKNAEASAEREKGTNRILWGLVGIFIMVSAYGLINLIQSSLSPIGA